MCYLAFVLTDLQLCFLSTLILPFRDTSVLYLLDQLCKAAYITEGSFQVIIDHLFEKHQVGTMLSNLIDS